MPKPTFICIGAQKAGTTSLINYLSQHPEIFMHKGEKHLFDKGGRNYKLTKKDIEDYENSFQTDKLIIGEKSPSYCYLQFAINRIHNYNPNMKLLLILREPITRAFSEYNMILGHRGKNLNSVNEEQIMKDFEKEEKLKLSQLRQNGNYYIIRGFYDEIIEYILSKFPKENLYIAISEEIKENKEMEYNKIMKFLGASNNIEIDTNVDTHIAKYEKTIPNLLETKLHNIYKPHNEKLYKILGRKIKIWEKYYENL